MAQVGVTCAGSQVGLACVIHHSNQCDETSLTTTSPPHYHLAHQNPQHNCNKEDVRATVVKRGWAYKVCLLLYFLNLFLMSFQVASRRVSPSFICVHSMPAEGEFATPAG